MPDAGQQCATLSVPLDYRRPHGRTIDVAVSRVQSAKPELRRGVLVGNPGGPGGPGVDLPRIFSVLFPQSVRDRYDLIGFDPRGVGTSAPVSCGVSAREMNQALVPLMQPGGFDATVAFTRRIADGCARTSGRELPYMTTANTARDLDRIRRALGERRISYLGYSYGTYLGAVYASLFPQRTDRFVLDSATSPNWLWRKQFRAWGLGGEVRFPDFAAFAAARDDTYHLGATPDEVRDHYLRLIARLGAKPITFPDGTVLNDALFRSVTFGGLYNDAIFPSLAELWQLVDSSSAGAELQALVRGLGPGASTSAAPSATPEDNGGASGLAVLCDDIAWSRSVPRYRRELRADIERRPLFGELGSNVWPCAFWPNGPIERPVPITARGPSNILIVQNLRDPATPLPGALQMRAALGRRTRTVLVDQGGHAVYAVTPNACANETTTAFLVVGPAGSDRFCSAEPAPTRSLRANGPDTARDRAVEELLRLMR